MNIDSLTNALTFNSKGVAWIHAHVGHQLDECLIWPFSKTASGYAKIVVRRRSTIVSRLMCCAIYGEPPSNKHHAAHSCGKGDKACVNPKHLRWATPKENNADKHAHGTHRYGEMIVQHKLSADDVRQIRNLHAGGVSQYRLAKNFGVHAQTLACIVHGRIWKHVT